MESPWLNPCGSIRRGREPPRPKQGWYSTPPRLLAGSPSPEARRMGPADLGLCTSRTVSQNQSPSPIKLACLRNFFAAMKNWVMRHNSQGICILAKHTMVTATHCFDVPFSQCKGAEILPVCPRWQPYAVNCNSVERMERTFFNNNESYQKNPMPVQGSVNYFPVSLVRAIRTHVIIHRLSLQWKAYWNASLWPEPCTKADFTWRDKHLTALPGKRRRSSLLHSPNTQDHLSHICLRVLYERLTLNMHLN